MGQIYTVKMRFKILPEKEKDLIQVVNNKIISDTRTDYLLDDYKKIGHTPDNINGIMNILLAGWQDQPLSIKKHRDGFTTYKNTFKASYGWDDVINSMFKAISPFIDNESELRLTGDNYYYLDKVINRGVQRTEYKEF